MFRKWKAEGNDMARSDGELDAFEAELVEAFRQLQRLPDRERAFLAMAGRSCMPQPVRDRWTDYPGDDTPRAPGLGIREMARLEAMFIAPNCLASRVKPADRRMVGVVLALRAWPERRGFRWERVWEELGGRGSGWVSTDAIRKRYEHWLDVMAKRWALICPAEAA